MENELELIRQCQTGDLTKFGGLYDQYAEQIFRFIYFRVRHKEIAQDLTSQTFFKALENFKSFDHRKGRFSSWLYRIAKNTVIDHWRVRKIHYDIDDCWDLAGKENPVEKSELKEIIRKVKEHLGSLDKEQREIVIMRIWDGLSHKEIAEILGKSEASSKMSFSRAMGKLRKGQLLALVVAGIFIGRFVV